jgi:hypothetical protein
MKKIWLLISLLMCCHIFIWCGNNQQQESNDTILFNELKKSFTWNIVDWTNREIVEITWDYTLYYNDEFWFATVLWEEWKWYSVWVWRVEDDVEFSWELTNLKRPMILFWTPMNKEIKDLFLMDYHYWFSVVSNDDVEKIKNSNDLWNTSFKNDYKWENNKYKFFEASTSWRWSQRYLIQYFPNLDCKIWTGWIEYDIEWNPHEYLDADCNGYEVINWEAVKTRKSWIEQLFPYWFIFYDID